MARVFVSHATEDLSLACEVHRWLIDGGHEAFLAHDLRDGITVGEEWERRLHDELRLADAVVCVVTSASLASRWCTAEVAIARSRGSKLLPVKAEAGVTDPFLTSVQHLDLTRDPDAVRPILIEALRLVDAVWPDGRCPFPGLRPFEVDQHRVFFGRTEETKELAELLRSPSEHAKGAALLVVGPSGCGKSSLVRAGLLPGMADEPGWWALPPIVPGADPVSALVRELAAAARQLGLDTTVRQVRQRLDDGYLTELADELLGAVPGDSRRRLLLVVDQFEELLTQTAPADRAQFARLLRPTLEGPVQLVATLRPEFLDQLLADPDLAALPTQVYPLRPLRREALRAVIERPARLAGIEVDDGLVDRLVDDTDSGEALPLLAFTLAELAESVTRGGRLSRARYDQLGGVQGALTRQADAALADALAAGGRHREDVIGGLLRLVTLDELGRPTRWRVRRDELPDQVITELNAFVTRRLLSTDTDNGAVVIGVAHEAFLSAWPPLAEAITTSASALRARRAMEHAASEWDNDGRSHARLWAGGQLAAAVTDTGARIRPGVASGVPPPRRRRVPRGLLRRQRVLVTDRVDLSVKSRDFLRASIRRDRFRHRRASTVLSVLLILALVAVGVAVVQQRITAEGQRVATSGQLVGQAEAARGTDLRTALLLGLAAHRIHPDSETHSSLLDTLTAGPYVATLNGHRASVNSVAFAPDGRTLATGSEDHTVILWDLTNRAQPRKLGQPLTGHTDAVTSVAFAPDGRTLATSSEDHTVILWDLTNRAQPRKLGQPLTGHTDAVTSVAFAPDGRTLATSSEDHTVILWDLTNRAQPRKLGQPLTGHTDAVNSVVWTPDGATLVTGSSDHTVILWDLTDRTQPRRLGPPLRGHTGSVNSIALTPDGHTLVTSSSVGNGAILWDVTDPAKPRQLGPPLSLITGSPVAVAFAPGGRILAMSSLLGTTLWDVTDPARPHPLGPPLSSLASPINAVAFSPDGRTLVTGSIDKTAILWDLTDPVQPQRLAPLLTGHTDWVKSVAFSPDGRTLATGSPDKTTILWDLTNPVQPQRLGPPLTDHTGRVFSVAFSPNGRTLATGSVDKTVILWDLTSRAQPHQLGLPLKTDSVFSVAFSPDGRTLATTSGDRAVILWDLTDPAQPHQLGQPLTGYTKPVESVAFSPDGRTLATGSVDATVILWDLTTRAQPRQLGPPLTGHTDAVWSVAFSPDGRTLATASRDGTTILWDLTDRSQPRQLGPPLTAQFFGAVNANLAVWSVAFSPDGRTLAVGGYDLVLWDLTDLAHPHRLGPPLFNNRAVLSVMFAPDGRTLAAGSLDGVVTLWDVTGLNQLRDHVVERACSVTHGGLDRAEWARYIPDLPYQATCPA